VADEPIQQLKEVMETGFGTLADLLAEIAGKTEAGFRELKNEVRETNARLDMTNARLDMTNERLDMTNERLDMTNERLGRVEGRLEGVEGRLDNLVELAGGETRRLNRELDALKVRVDALERKAS
jgi:uncharacterized coiled-coil DUF342 family protein